MVKVNYISNTDNESYSVEPKVSVVKEITNLSENIEFNSKEKVERFIEENFCKPSEIPILLFTRNPIKKVLSGIGQSIKMSDTAAYLTSEFTKYDPDTASVLEFISKNYPKEVPWSLEEFYSDTSLQNRYPQEVIDAIKVFIKYCLTKQSTIVTRDYHVSMSPNIAITNLLNYLYRWETVTKIDKQRIKVASLDDLDVNTRPLELLHSMDYLPTPTNEQSASKRHSAKAHQNLIKECIRELEPCELGLIYNLFEKEVNQRNFIVQNYPHHYMFTDE